MFRLRGIAKEASGTSILVGLSRQFGAVWSFELGLRRAGQPVSADVPGTHWEAQNLGGCATLLLSWAYYRIGLCRPQGDYDELRFPLIERWRGYVVGTDSLGQRVNWTPYADPRVEAIVPQTLLHLTLLEHWSVLCFASLSLSGIRHDGRWGKGEWYPRFLRGWYNLWRDRAQSRLALEMVGGLCSLPGSI
ncbi:hypothetical protein PIB30_053732 [Stylosanthes scabra]|uniref:Uncharacterized protein n=1 Tax=Stylosanthes scabra TaxID=79078 RepID=A0ABU6VH12_9FABA|nr:hypothetical protein [Stylosanthes scabra]